MKRHINEFLRTEFANSGRAAGAGISEDHYGDEDGNPDYEESDSYPRFPSDSLTDEERAALSGEVKIYKEAARG